ncbi:hypothetical protein D3C75_1158770 [compost metagenome]
MGWPQYKLPVMTVLKLDQLLAVDLISLRLFPQLSRLHRGHQDLLCTRGIHFLVDNLFNLAEHAAAKRQVGIDSGRQLADVSCTQQQLVVCGLGFSRSFAKGCGK